MEYQNVADIPLTRLLLCLAIAVCADPEMLFQEDCYDILENAGLKPGGDTEHPYTAEQIEALKGRMACVQHEWIRQLEAEDEAATLPGRKWKAAKEAFETYDFGDTVTCLHEWQTHNEYIMTAKVTLEKRGGEIFVVVFENKNSAVVRDRFILD